MLPILFYGVPEGCSFGSIVALEWSGLRYRLCRIEMPDVVSSEDYRRVNPVAETPSLRTADGRIVSQSIAILHHIGAADPESGLVPAAGSAQFDRFNEVLAFLNTGFFDAFAPYWYALEHQLEGRAADALRAMGRHKVRKAYADLERLLGRSPWLAGEWRSAADAYFAGIARWNDFHQVVDVRDYKAVDGLRQRLLEDAAVQFARAVEHGDDAHSTGRFAGHVSLAEVLADTSGQEMAPRPA
jgi:glutathione S-transferase